MANRISLTAQMALNTSTGTSILNTPALNYSGNQLDADGKRNGGSYKTTGSYVTIPVGDVTVDATHYAWFYFRNESTSDSILIGNSDGSIELSKLLPGETYGPVKHPFKPQIKAVANTPSLAYVIFAA